MKLEWIDPETVYIFHDGVMYCIFQQEGKLVMESKKITTQD